MNRRRLALVFLTIPFAVYAWACSSDSTDTNAGADAGTSPTSTTPTPTPPPEPPPAPPPPPDDAGDAGAAVTCVGNPLTADGGSPDGGATLDAAVASRILDEPVATALGNTFVDGPQFFDLNGGTLVFSELYSNPPTLVRMQSDGGARTVIRSSAANNQFFIGNGIRDGGLLTTLAVGNGPAADAGLVVSNPAVTTNDGGASIGIGASTNPNDFVVGPKGDLYVTDPQYQNSPAGTTGIYRIAPNGTVTGISTTAERVNGIALSPDASKLYVSVTDAKKITSYPIAADGSVTNTVTTLVSATADAPDGIAIDVGGNLWVAEANETSATESGRVEVFAPDGKKLGEIPFPTQRPTSVAFGGADNKTLFVTVEKGVYVFSSRCAGIR